MGSMTTRMETAMPTFDTAQPISLHLALGFVVANVRIRAADRTDTTVEVRPTTPTARADVRVAEQTTADFADGQLTVRAPRLNQLFTRTGSIEVVVDLPSGSHVQGETGMGEIVTEGRLGDCRLKSGFGQVRLHEAGTVQLTTGSGDIAVGSVTGSAEITAANGEINVARIDGPATIKNSNGLTWLGVVGGELRVRGANGAIRVDRAEAGVVAKTANGSVRLGQVVRGAVSLETAAGALEVGIRTGSAAWLDLKTSYGRVRNELDAAAGPAASDETVEVRARTHVGDITIHRVGEESA
jgi:DUF4097 and DUF4098 domain-containing protein YvlB